MSKAEIKGRIEKLEERIWWLNMADRFRPDEEAEWRRLHHELESLKRQLKEA